jgi:hypothetical protein
MNESSNPPSLAESDFESILCKYPDIIEKGLTLIGRQQTVYGRRIDLLFQDEHMRKLLVELKVGPIKDQHIGQLLAYEGLILSHDDPSLRVMLIGNRVPANISKALDHHGIAWREITFSVLRDYLISKSDRDFIRFFDQSAKPAQVVPAIKAVTNEKGNPALFAPIEAKWLSAAFDFLKTKDKLFFTSGAHIGAGMSLPIVNVYFKIKKTTVISAKATFLQIVTENPSQYRLPGNENEISRFYYGFKNLKQLSNKVPLQDLKYYSTHSNLKNDVPGACFIIDPEVE